MTCTCDLPDGTPHDCSKERQIDAGLSFVALSELELCRRQFYPGWADAAGKAAGAKERGVWYMVPRGCRAEREPRRQTKRVRSIIDAGFEMGRVSLDVALKLTSEA